MKKQWQKSKALIEDSIIRFVTATKLKTETAIIWNAVNAILIEWNTQLQQLVINTVKEADLGAVFIQQQQFRIQTLNEKVQELRSQLKIAAEVLFRSSMQKSLISVQQKDKELFIEDDYRGSEQEGSETD